MNNKLSDRKIKEIIGYSNLINHKNNKVMKSLNVIEMVLNDPDNKLTEASRDLLEDVAQKLNIDIDENALEFKFPHTKGVWLGLKVGFDTKITNSKGHIIGGFKNKADAKLASNAPVLLKIAELYYYSLRSNSQQSTRPFKLIMQVFNNLKSKNEV